MLEILNENFELLMEYRNYRIYDANHTVKRFEERIELESKVLFDFIKKCIDYLIDNNLSEKENRYCFVSNKYKFKLPMEWRSDRNNNKTFIGICSTVLSWYMRPKLTDKEIRDLKEQKYDFAWLESKDYMKELDKIGYHYFYECGEICSDFKEILIKDNEQKYKFNVYFY